MDEHEVEPYIRKASRALKSHNAELRWSRAPDDIRAAMGVTLSVLEMIANEHPERHSEIAAITAKYRQY